MFGAPLLPTLTITAHLYIYPTICACGAVGVFLILSYIEAITRTMRSARIFFRRSQLQRARIHAQPDALATPATFSNFHIHRSPHANEQFGAFLLPTPTNTAQPLMFIWVLIAIARNVWCEEARCDIKRYRDIHRDTEREVARPRRGARPPRTAEGYQWIPMKQKVRRCTAVHEDESTDINGYDAWAPPRGGRAPPRSNHNVSAHTCPTVGACGASNLF